MFLFFSIFGDSMKKNLGDLRWFPPQNLFKYPHMFGLEARIIDSWLILNNAVISRITYDVPVGEGRSVGEQSTIKLDLGARYSTSFKMDALADLGDCFYIIEVKGSATLEAFGQLLSYIHLFKNAYEVTKPCYLKLICADAHPDLISLSKIHKIDVVLIDISTQ